MAPSKPDSDRLARALDLLAAEAGERLAAHPWGHLAPPGGSHLELRLRLPTNDRGVALDAAGQQLDRQLTEAIQALLTHRATLRPGHVFCLRCGAATCDHTAPDDPRQVFAGYGPSGLPRFADFGQWLLYHHHPQVDRLYGKAPPLVAQVTDGQTLTRELLPAYRDLEGGFTIHGQVAAGWYTGRDEDGRPISLAVSFQVVSSQARGSRRRHALNVVGAVPGEQTLAAFWDRNGGVPWSGPVRWAQTILDQIDAAPAKKARRQADRRIEGLLSGLARRLEKERRSKDRRTQHAEERHASGRRPTRMAVADLRRAGDGQIFADARHQTLVVLGEKGRAHVFNSEGKLVTSIRFPTETIEKRRKLGTWTDAGEDAIRDLKSRVEGAHAP